MIIESLNTGTYRRSTLAISYNGDRFVTIALLERSDLTVVEGTEATVVALVLVET